MNNKIEVLNRFMGWEPYCVSANADQGDLCCAHGMEPHTNVPFNPYADTPEAREWTKRLKDEFVRRTHRTISVHTHLEITGLVWWIELERARFDGHTLSASGTNEHHAILDAIYEAIKQ